MSPLLESGRGSHAALDGGGGPAFTALVDDNVAMTLLDPFNVQVNSAGGGNGFGESMGSPPGSLAGPLLSSDMTIEVLAGGTIDLSSANSIPTSWS